MIKNGDYRYGADAKACKQKFKNSFQKCPGLFLHALCVLSSFERIIYYGMVLSMDLGAIRGDMNGCWVCVMWLLKVYKHTFTYSPGACDIALIWAYFVSAIFLSSPPYFSCHHSSHLGHQEPGASSEVSKNLSAS
jgi:hypothetical protein